MSEALACLDVWVKRIGADRTKTAVNDHPVRPLLRDEANDWTSSFEMVRDLVIDALSDDCGAWPTSTAARAGAWPRSSATSGRRSP